MLMAITTVTPAAGESAPQDDAASIADTTPTELPEPSASQTDERLGSSEAELRQAIADTPEGLVRTVVTLALDVAVEADLSSAAVDNQRSAIAAALGDLAAGLEGTASEVLSEFEVVPSAVILLDETGLERLLADPTVAAITLDQAFPLALDVSTGVVQSDALNTAGILGNNFEGATGGRYEVAVLDTGTLLTHNAFTGRVVAGACFSRGSDGVLNGVWGLSERHRNPDRGGGGRRLHVFGRV